MAHRRHRQSRGRRVVPALWFSGAAAATILVLGVNGTLSSWTSAIITNDPNTAGAGAAVALTESKGGASCETATTTTNSVTCSTINKYGGNLALTPGGTASSVEVTFTNTGNGAAAKFGYTPGTCTDTGGTLCSSGSLTVAISCVTGTTFASGTAIPGLTQPAVAPSAIANKLGTAVSVAAGGSVTCQFVTSLISTAPATDAGDSVSQPITWTLSSV